MQQKKGESDSQVSLDHLSDMHEDFERAINRNDTVMVPDYRSDPVVINPSIRPGTVRAKLNVIIHSHKFMVSVIVLVVLDCLLVLAELLFDLEIIILHEEHEMIPEVFHYLSIAVLCVFLIEIAIRIYVMRCEFLKHKLEVFDAIVVVISFVLDIVFIHNEGATNGVGLLVLLRLWRITRIINGIVMSVRTEAEEKVEEEKALREQCELELQKSNKICAARQAEIETLKDLLRKNNIEVPETEDSGVNEIEDGAKPEGIL